MSSIEELRLRVEALERAEQPRVDHLVRVYLDLMVNPARYMDVHDTIWCSLCERITPADIEALSARVKDPLPWRVLVSFTVEMVKRGRAVSFALICLHRVARVHLDRRGFRTLSVGRALTCPLVGKIGD